MPVTYRTDRNNNPAAITTDIAAQAGLRRGVDYVNGEPFMDSHGRTYYTAKLLGLSPVDQTIQVIDAIGYYTKDGKLRWDYIGIPSKVWDSLTRQQKISVVWFHYQREGGSALCGAFASAMASTPAAEKRV